MNRFQKSGAILGDAFLYYSLHLYAFKNKSEEERNNGLKLLYTHCSKAADLYGGVTFTDDQQGALLWLSAKNFPLGMIREINQAWLLYLLKLV